MKNHKLRKFNFSKYFAYVNKIHKKNQKLKHMSNVDVYKKNW